MKNDRLPHIGYTPLPLTDEQWQETPCVVILRHPDGNDKFYGPFRGLDEANEWCAEQVKQEFNGTFIVMPMRSPWMTRSYLDWWTPDYVLSPETVQEDFGFAPIMT